MAILALKKSGISLEFQYIKSVGTLKMESLIRQDSDGIVEHGAEVAVGDVKKIYFCPLTSSAPPKWETRPPKGETRPG